MLCFEYLDMYSVGALYKVKLTKAHARKNASMLADSALESVLLPMLELQLCYTEHAKLSKAADLKTNMEELMQPNVNHW